MLGLTPQRETFACELAKGGTQAAAYRIAYPKSVRWSENAVAVNASRMASNAHVRLRVEELRAKAAAANDVTLATHVATLKDLREEARAAAQFSPAVKAEELRGKASGLYIEKHEFSGAGGGPIVLVICGKEVDPGKLGWLG